MNTRFIGQHDGNSISTAEFAARHHVKPQSIRARMTRTGSYYGVVPVVLANRRLAWPNVLVSK